MVDASFAHLSGYFDTWNLEALEGSRLIRQSPGSFSPQTSIPLESSLKSNQVGLLTNRVFRPVSRTLGPSN